ncbi:methyltransferase [Amycolatopsis sp. NPDC049253]|uniref:methyltransferase n=1 Tax=Amycolatopsis sp. NPDC049253 TaxID=3155274 RepID=UPI0034271B43
MTEATPFDPARMVANTNKMLGMITGLWMSQTMRALCDLRIVDHLADGATTSAEVADLEHIDPSATFRLMRAAAGIGVLGYADGKFTVTEFGSLLRAGVPGSMRDIALVTSAPFHWQAWSQFPEAIRHGRTQAPAALGLPEGATSFDYFADHPEEGALFAAAMSNATGMITEDVSPMIDLTGVTSAVDVGGANGALVLTLMRTNPELHGIVLDRPNVVPGAEQAARDAALTDRFTAVGGDFFVEVPQAEVYLLKMILHDWDDDDCVRILHNCRTSAKPGARAFVVETVLDPIGEPGLAAMLDLNMLAVTNGQERDLSEFDALYAKTGWQRVSQQQTHTAHVIQELIAI